MSQLKDDHNLTYFLDLSQLLDEEIMAEVRTGLMFLHSFTAELDLTLLKEDFCGRGQTCWRKEHILGGIIHANTDKQLLASQGHWVEKSLISQSGNRKTQGYDLILKFPSLQTQKRSYGCSGP